MLIPIYPLSLALLFIHLRLRRHGRVMFALAAYALACACPLFATWLGLDFSPSFTMMFLAANLLLCALAECAALMDCMGHVRGERVRMTLRLAHGVLIAAGMLLSLPAVYIYAVGDDMLSLCVRGAPIAGALLTLGWATLQWRKKQRVGVELMLNWLSLSAACFALGCGLRSTSLLPYGAGLLLMSAANLLDGQAIPRPPLFWLGLCCASVFAIAPML